MSEPALPLRLQVEPAARKAFGSCFVLPSRLEDQICLIVTEDGLIAIAVCHTSNITEALKVLELEPIDAPKFVYDASSS